MCSPSGDQSGRWRSISMTSQWPLIMTSQWGGGRFCNDIVRVTHFEITMCNDVAIT